MEKTVLIWVKQDRNNNEGQACSVDLKKWGGRVSFSYLWSPPIVRESFPSRQAFAISWESCQMKRWVSSMSTGCSQTVHKIK